MPWLYLSTFFERYKDEYIENLFLVSSEGSWSRWIEFCLRGVVSQATEAVRICEELRAAKDEMYSRITCGSGRIRAIVDNLFSHPYTRISTLSKELNVTYHTARNDVDFLVKNEILSLVEGLRPKTYVSQKIVHIAYGDDLAKKNAKSDSGLARIAAFAKGIRREGIPRAGRAPASGRCRLPG